MKQQTKIINKTTHMKLWFVSDVIMDNTEKQPSAKPTTHDQNSNRNREQDETHEITVRDCSRNTQSRQTEQNANRFATNNSKRQRRKIQRQYGELIAKPTRTDPSNARSQRRPSYDSDKGQQITRPKFLKNTQVSKTEQTKRMCVLRV